MRAGCACCGGEAGADHLRGLRRCPACTHVWADMRLSADELRALYAANYFQGEEYLDYEKEAPALRRNFRLRLRELTARAPAGHLWEIGAAYGHFLKEAGRYYSVAGCDISAHAAAQAQERLGQEVACGDYLTMDVPMAQDVVCLWDTVEHLAAPEAYLARAAEQLKPGGLLALSTGDIGAWLPRIRGEQWRLIHPPTHLHYFTVRSMRTLLERLGFGTIEVHHPAFWRSADAVAFRLLGYPPERRTAALYRGLRKAGVLNFSFPVNTFDLMTVYARKGGV